MYPPLSYRACYNAAPAEINRTSANPGGFLEFRGQARRKDESDGYKFGCKKPIVLFIDPDTASLLLPPAPKVLVEKVNKMLV